MICPNDKTRPQFFPEDDLGSLVFHEDMLGSWAGCAEISAFGSWPLYTAPGGPAQTWPVRSAQGARAARADRKLLLETLGPASEVRNFFGTGHGWVEIYGPEKIEDTTAFGYMSLKASDYKRAIKNRRYRFVFLHGCKTDSPLLFNAFGADRSELAHDFSPASLLQLSDYAGNLRPAAFLGWNNNVPYVRPLSEATPDGFGNTCVYEHIEGICFFVSQIADNWAYGQGWGPLPLEEAILYAQFDTTQLYDSEDLQQLDVTWLKQYGYRDLRCIEYNRFGDWEGH